MAMTLRVVLWSLVLLLGGELTPLVAQNAPLDNSAPVEPPRSQFKLKKKRKKFAAAAAPQDAAEAPAPEPESKKSKFSGSVGVSHGATFGPQSIPVSAASLMVIYAPSEAHTFFVSPGARKYYEIDAGQDEVDLTNTKLGYAYSIYNGETMANSVALDAVVATNQLSRAAGMIAEPRVAYKLGASFFEDVTLGLSLSPSMKYYVKEYKQTVDGQLLPQVQYAVNSGLSLNFYRAFSLAASATYAVLEYEGSRYTNSGELKENQLPDERYVTSLTATLPLPKGWELSAGYEHASSIDQYGSLEFILFEQEASEWFVGVDYNF